MPYPVGPPVNPLNDTLADYRHHWLLPNSFLSFYQASFFDLRELYP